MDRVYTAGASATPPSAPGSPSSGYPTAGNPSLGVQATRPGAWWYYMITEEIRNVLVAAGITPDHTDLTQLSDAIAALIAAGIAAGTAAHVPWSGITGKPTTVAGYGITDMGSQSVSHADTAGSAATATTATTASNADGLTGVTDLRVGSVAIGARYGSGVYAIYGDTFDAGNPFILYEIVSPTQWSAPAGTWKSLGLVDLTPYGSGQVAVRIA